jgi:hypothetical protein
MKSYRNQLLGETKTVYLNTKTRRLTLIEKTENSEGPEVECQVEKGFILTQRYIKEVFFLHTNKKCFVKITQNKC